MTDNRKPPGFRDRAIVYHPEEKRLMSSSRKEIEQRLTEYATLPISKLQSRVPIYVDAEVDLTKNREDENGESNDFLAVVQLNHLSLANKLLRLTGAMSKLYVPRAELEMESKDDPLSSSANDLDSKL